MEITVNVGNLLLVFGALVLLYTIGSILVEVVEILQHYDKRYHRYLLHPRSWNYTMIIVFVLSGVMLILAGFLLR